MLLINDSQMRSAVSCLDMVESVERAFCLFATGQCDPVDRMTARFGKDAMLYMPCRADGVIGTKILAEFPGNPSQGLPYLSGMMLLNDAATGQVCAILNGQTLTALRTAAVGAAAVRHFAPEQADTLGVVGCGVQGLHQAAFGLQVRPIKTLYVYNHSPKDFPEFFRKVREISGRDDLNCQVCESADELLEKSRIVITATQAKTPLFTNDPARFQNKCLVAIGSWQPFMREIPDAIFQAADRIVTDLPFALEECGDFTQPLESGILKREQVEFMGDILVQNTQRAMEQGTCYYKSVGMGVFDAVAARMIYEKAREKKLGTEIDW